MKPKELSERETSELLDILRERFEKNKIRHQDIKWTIIEEKLKNNPAKLWSLNQMEISGGEPNVVNYDKTLMNICFSTVPQKAQKEEEVFAMIVKLWIPEKKINRKTMCFR